MKLCNEIKTFIKLKKLDYKIKKDITLLPSMLQSVERAIADLRRGSIVIVAGNEHALLVQAAEGLTREALARISALSKEKFSSEI